MDISIAEGLYLIALDDDEGRLLAAAEKNIVEGLLSASILELIVLEKVGAVNGRLTKLSSDGTGNILLDNVFSALEDGKTVIQNLKELAPHFKNVQDDVTEMLIARGVLKRESTKLLWIPVSERMDNANYAYEQNIRDTITGIVKEGNKPSSTFVVLTSLIYFCHLLPEIFKDGDDHIDAVKVAKDILKSDSISGEVMIVLDDLKSHFDH